MVGLFGFYFILLWGWSFLFVLVCGLVDWLGLLWVLFVCLFGFFSPWFFFPSDTRSGTRQELESCHRYLCTTKEENGPFIS